MNLVRLRLADETTIDVTDSHLFWSVDRHDWVAAGELRPGERLDGNDEVATVAEVKPLGHAPAVYNLEVHGQHVFRVATPAVLVHNTNPCTGGRFAPNKLAVAGAIERGELSVVRPGRIGATKGSGIHEHHVFPQEYKALFKMRGIDVHDYAVDVPVSSHQAIHGGGDFKLGRTWRGEWNAQIMRELKQTTRAAGRRLTPDEIVSVAENLMSRYGISGELHRYSRAPNR